jgi:hypothetical protein
MALRLFEKSLTSIPTELRRLYLPDSEHGYRLDLSDLDDFVHGLKSALRKERETIKELKARFGVTPDGAEALAPFGEIPGANEGRTVPDVRAGLLPRKSLSA